jgi:mannose-1-phosphate guanylyltransferase
MPAREQSLGYQNHQRCLSGSTHAQVAHTDYGAVQTSSLKPATAISRVAQFHCRQEQPRETLKQYIHCDSLPWNAGAASNR